MRILTPAFALLFIAHLLQSTAGALLLHLPGLLDDLGASEAAIGIIIACGAGIAILSSPGIGRVLDRSSTNALTAAALCLAAGLTLALSQLPRLDPVFLVLFLLLEVLIAFLHSALFLRAIQQLEVPRRARGLAVFSVATMGAVGLAAVLGDLVLGYDGYRGLFVLMTALYLIALLPIALLQSSATSQAPDRSESAEDVAPTPEPARSGYFAAISDPALWPIWCISTGFFAAMVSVFVFLKLTTASTGTGSLGLYFAIYTSVAVALRVVAGGLPDRFGLLTFAIVTVLIYAFGFIVLAAAASVTTFVVAAALGGIGHGFGYPVMMALAAETGRQTHQGSTITTFNAIDQGMTLLAAPALGWVLGTTSPATLYLLAGTLAALGASGAWALTRMRYSHDR